MDMNLYGKDNKLSNELCPECSKPFTILNSVVYSKVVLKCYNPDCKTNYPDFAKWQEQSQNGRVWFCPSCGEPKIHYDFKNGIFVCWNCLFRIPEKQGVSLKILVELQD